MSSSSSSSSSSSGAADHCPVDHGTRERWVEAARVKGSQPFHPHSSFASPNGTPPRFSLDSLSWQTSLSDHASPISRRSRLRQLSSEREISSIPRAITTDLPTFPNSAERAAMRQPANNEQDTGQDKDSGNWIYPSPEMFFNAMKRKGYDAQAADMDTIVPIHNAVNERAWEEIKKWEFGRGSERCGGPKLVSFAGDSKALTPKARWNSLLGYQQPFDRHDWVVDRCGQHIDYVIDFYPGKDAGVSGKSVSFFVDVRPKLNSWEGIKMRMSKGFGG